MRFKTIGQILILFLLGACLLLAGLYIGLPVIVESQLKKQLQQYNLPGDLNFHIEKIGLTHAQVSGISLNEKPVADHLDLFYALERISQLHILKVVVSGVKIHGDLDAQNKLTIEGLSLFKPKEMGKNNTTPSFFSYLPDRVIIKNSMVTVSAVSDQFYLPFDGLAIIGKQNETIDFRAHIYPFGEKISLQAAYGLKQGLQAAQAKARAFDLEHLNALIGNKPLNTRLAGKCDFNIQYSASEKRWSADLSHLGLQSGFDFGLKDITCDFNSDGQKRVFNGAFSTQYNAITPMTFAYTLVWDATKADPYHFKIKSKKTDQMVLTHASGKARLRHPQIMIDVTANAQKGMGTVIMKTGPAGLTSKQRSANSDSAVIKGSVSFDNSDNGVVFNVKPHIRLSRVTARHSGDFAVFPAVTLSGVASYNSHRGPDGSIQLDAVGGRLDFKSQQITATGIDVHIPIQFPSVKKQKTGTYRIVKALWNGQYPVSAKGKIKQLGLWNVKIDGQITSDFLKKLHPEFECIVHLDKTMEVALEYSVPPFELNGADIKRIVPEFNLDADMSMTVSANGKAGLSNHQFDTRMVLEIKEGRFEMPELKMTAKGINSRIIFNDLLTLETEPGQMMTIDQVNIDKIDIDDAKLRFSIEDAKYILLENFKFKWCKGLVSTEAIRFPNIVFLFIWKTNGSYQRRPFVFQIKRKTIP